MSTRPDPFACAPTVVLVLPLADTALQNLVRVRVTVADPNEQTDPCHHNYPRSCNHEDDGPALQLFFGEYQLPSAWKRVAGTPLNGTWETVVDTRDYSNGAKQLRVSARGVGCCRVEGALAVTVSNTLQGGIFYRDICAQAQAGFVVGDAGIGLETRALEENTARRYWMEWGVRSGTDLDATPDKPYQHVDWAKHQLVLPVKGAEWLAQGQRVARCNYSAHVTFRLPLSRYVRFRRKWTPQFYLSCFDLHAQHVAKIRELEAGKHLVFTTSPPRVWAYDGDTVKTLADFSIAPSGEGRGASFYAPSAVDVAMSGGKIFVCVAPSNDIPRGELFAFDPDASDYTMNYSPRGETRTPRFVEAVAALPLALFVGNADTRAYDLTYAAPHLVWGLSSPATYTRVEGDTLFVACGHKLFSTDGTSVPTLLFEFAANVSAASANFVGLANGQVWKKTSTGYVLSFSGTGAIGGALSWTGGTIGEAQVEDARGAFGGVGDWLSGERQNGTWYQERQLKVPIDLAPKTVTAITALDHFSIEVDASGADDAEAVPQRDERLLIGTGESGLLFVYQRSALSEALGAIPVSHDTIPRLFPYVQRAPTS